MTMVVQLVYVAVVVVADQAECLYQLAAANVVNDNNGNGFDDINYDDAGDDDGNCVDDHMYGDDDNGHANDNGAEEDESSVYLYNIMTC